MQIYLATLETRNFRFDGAGTTPGAARAALHRATEFHGRQLGLPYGWAKDDLADIEPRVITTGASYRDGEEIK